MDHLRALLRWRTLHEYPDDDTDDDSDHDTG
jgi:hypothetical protein